MRLIAKLIIYRDSPSKRDFFLLFTNLFYEILLKYFYLRNNSNDVMVLG
jgi:hypothetical protein